MRALTGDEIGELKTRFLSKLWQHTKENLEISVSASSVWDEIQMGAYNKEIVMPFIVRDLIEEELIKHGNNPGEVMIVRRAPKMKAIYLLDIFNKIVNRSSDDSTAIGVTLNVQGITVSGLLISRKKYYDEVYNVISLHSSDSEGWKLLFEDMKKFLPRNEDEWDLTDDVMGITVLCLKDAKYLIGAEPIPVSGPALWIGKIESVDGFMIGTLRGSKTTALEQD